MRTTRPKIPAIGSREWKQLKRQQWRKVLKAMGEFDAGCYHTPEYRRYLNIRAEAEELRKSLSVKKWGR